MRRSLLLLFAILLTVPVAILVQASSKRPILLLSLPTIRAGGILAATAIQIFVPPILIASPMKVFALPVFTQRPIAAHPVPL